MLFVISMACSYTVVFFVLHPVWPRVRPFEALLNVNQLIGEVDGIEGIKTGETEGSLGNLITKTTRNGNSIIAVVLGSHDRFSESKSLIEWAFAAYIWASAQ